MKITILTTQTTHHTFFVNSLLNLGYDISVFLESNQSLIFPFTTFHEYENLRENYEREKWFSGRLQSTLIDDLIDSKKFDSINCIESVNAIRKENSDLIIVFGTGLIKKEFIKASSNTPILNLHGGDPEKYRGLDSHLWAIYHRDYNSLVTTIHKLDENLDTGEIILKGKLIIQQGSRLETLRSINTEMCVELSKFVIDMFCDNRRIISTPQIQRGRYYSAMPSELKSLCVKNFKDFFS